MWQRIISYERWLICRNEDASKKNVATEIVVFDFELFIGGRCFEAHTFRLNLLFLQKTLIFGNFSCPGLRKCYNACVQ